MGRGWGWGLLFVFLLTQGVTLLESGLEHTVQPRLASRHGNQALASCVLWSRVCFPGPAGHSVFMLLGALSA